MSTHLLTSRIWGRVISKLSMLDRREELSHLGLWGLRLYFTTENTREVDRVLRDYLNQAPFEPGSCTRGLYLRGLD